MTLPNGTDLSGFLLGFKNIRHPRAPRPAPRRECRARLPTALHTSYPGCTSLSRNVLHSKVWDVNRTQQGTKEFFNRQEDEISNSDILAEVTLECVSFEVTKHFQE